MVDGLSEKSLRRLVSEAVKNAEIVKPPEDLTPNGQLVEYLVSFLTSNFSARARDEILLGKPYADPDERKTYFRVRDFTQFLDQKRCRGVTRPGLFKTFRDLGGEPITMSEKGEIFRAWRVPTPEIQSEEFDLPEELSDRGEADF